MSLINDALRRAGQRQRQEPPKPSSLPPLQPVEYRRRPGPNVWPTIIMLPTAFILLGLAGFFIWAFTEYRRAAATQAAATAAQESVRALTAAIPGPETNRLRQPQRPIAGPLETTTASPAPEAPAAVASSLTNAPAAPETSTNAQATAAVVPPTPPPLKLQGIYYSRSNPAALINGKALFVGETVEGARVVRIERESVTLEQGGKTNVLRMP